MNGGYPAQHAYPDTFTHAPANVNSAASFQPAPSSTPSNAPANDQKNGISKDEVGWYFVEQYYTNMSRSPEKLHLFYSRRSQLVFGTEAETVQVAVGQKVRVDISTPWDLPCPVRSNILTSSLHYRLSMTRSSSLTSKTARSVS